MAKPLLIIINGLPGSGKTTLSRRLAPDLGLPVFSRDSIYETLYDALDCEHAGLPPRIGHASYALLYASASSILAAGQAVMIEAFFGNPPLRSTEIRQLQRAYHFESLQILCRANGRVLIERFLARMENEKRHISHRSQDQAWIKQNREQLLQGSLEPLALGGQLVEIDTTIPDSFDYAGLVRRIQATIEPFFENQ